MTEEENKNCISKSRALKENVLNRFSMETRDATTKIIDELVCEVLFQIHMDINTGMADPKFYSKCDRTSSDESLIDMTKLLSINSLNQNIHCPKCLTKIKCMWLSRHLFMCLNPHIATYSNRACSRLARKRIQDDAVVSIADDELQGKPKKRGRKPNK